MCLLRETEALLWSSYAIVVCSYTVDSITCDAVAFVECRPSVL